MHLGGKSHRHTHSAPHKVRRCRLPNTRRPLSAQRTLAPGASTARVKAQEWPPSGAVSGAPAGAGASRCPNIPSGFGSNTALFSFSMTASPPPPPFFGRRARGGPPKPKPGAWGTRSPSGGADAQRLWGGTWPGFWPSGGAERLQLVAAGPRLAGRSPGRSGPVGGPIHSARSGAAFISCCTSWACGTPRLPTFLSRVSPFSLGKPRKKAPSP